MDSATKSVQAILGGLEYDCFRDLVVFDEHDETNADGKVVRKFDKDRLQKIVDVCNQRFQKDGSPALIGPGHTLLAKDAKESDQPAIWGLATDFRVGEFGPSQKTGILATFYMKRAIDTTDERGNPKVISGHQALKEYPRPSIELWHKENLIDWIALGRRRPERDLGLLMCSKDASGKICYQKATDDKLLYTMDPEESPSIDKPALADTDTENEFNPEEVKQYERAWKYFCKSKGMSQYSSACMSTTNTALPGGNKEVKQMSATPEEVLQYQKERDEAKAESAKLKAEVDTLKADKAETERVAQYAKRLAEIGVTKDINEAEELAFCVGAFKEVSQFQKYAERLDKNSKGKNEPPIGGTMVKTAVGKEETIDSNMDKAEQVVQYMKRHEGDPEFAGLGSGPNAAILRYNKALADVNQGKI